MNSATFEGAVDSRGWKLQYLPSGKKLWTKKGRFSVNLEGNAWGGGKVTDYPEGTTSESVIIAMSAVSNDNAISVSVGPVSNQIKYSVHNAYGSAVSANIDWGAIVIEA